jgi:hypothetical protein
MYHGFSSQIKVCLFLTLYKQIVFTYSRLWGLPDYGGKKGNYKHICVQPRCFEFESRCFQKRNQKLVLCAKAYVMEILSPASLICRRSIGSGSGGLQQKKEQPHPTRGSFPGDKAAGTWTWPLTSIYCRGQRMSGAIPLLSQYALMAWYPV